MLAIPPQEIGIPAVVLYELEYGIARSKSPEKRRRQLEDLCSLVTVLSFGRAEARQTAAIRAKLEKKGTPIGPYDLLIAGTALASRATLVTANRKEFSRIPKLQIENWFQKGKA